MIAPFYSHPGIDVFPTASNHAYGEGPNDVFLVPHCTGSEIRLKDCNYETYPSNCTHDFDAGVVFWPGMYVESPFIYNT